MTLQIHHFVTLVPYNAVVQPFKHAITMTQMTSKCFNIYQHHVSLIATTWLLDNIECSYEDSYVLKRKKSGTFN